MNRWVSGVVKVKVFGGLTIIGRESPYASYSKDLVDYVSGWYPSEEEARGFIRMHVLHSLTAYRTRHKARETIVKKPSVKNTSIWVLQRSGLRMWVVYQGR